MLDKSLITVIVKTGAKISKVICCDGNLSQEQSSRIGADGSAFEIRDNFFLAQVLKSEEIGVTVFPASSDF
jgi:hypothetical protein